MLPMIYMALVDDDDLPAFERLYEDYKDIAVKCANKILHNDALSEECVSETFLAVAKNYKTISKREMDEQVKYLYISVRNRAYNIIEKEKHTKNDLPLDEAIKISEDMSEFKYLELRDCISKLSQTDQDILYAVGRLGLTHTEIADCYGISYAAARQRYYNAKQNLSELLFKETV